MSAYFILRVQFHCFFTLFFLSFIIIRIDKNLFSLQYVNTMYFCVVTITTLVGFFSIFAVKLAKGAH
jgi:hypothetical protein